MSQSDIVPVSVYSQMGGILAADGYISIEAMNKLTIGLFWSYSIPLHEYLRVRFEQDNECELMCIDHLGRCAAWTRNETVGYATLDDRNAEARSDYIEWLTRMENAWRAKKERVTTEALSSKTIK